MNLLAHWDPFRAGLAMPETLRWTPFNDSDIDFAFDAFRPATWRTAAPEWRMDVADSDAAYYLAIDLPGARKDSIQVSVEENYVTVAADTAQEQPSGEQPVWLVKQRHQGEIRRTLAFPEALEENACEARYSEGVLYLKLQKKRAARIKRITVQ